MNNTELLKECRDMLTNLEWDEEDSLGLYCSGCDKKRPYDPGGKYAGHDEDCAWVKLMRKLDKAIEDGGQ